MRAYALLLLSASAILGSLGCNIEVNGGTCQDPRDPDVHYVSHDPAGCRGIDFSCAPQQEPFADACGCGCIGPEPSHCPAPADPEVYYVSRDPGECALIDFDCSPPQRHFSNECGCGCIGPEHTQCPDPADPEVHYISRDPGECAVIDFDCSPPQRFFSNECGCGCIGPKPIECPDPGDPSVHYVSMDPGVCEVVDYACAPGQSGFGLITERSECGCGCIDTACHGLSEADCAASPVCAPAYASRCDCDCVEGPDCEACEAACFGYVGCRYTGERAVPIGDGR